jgi:8-oxo-dGTP pyrophosphatase MutT (NUDIX family)
MPEQIKTIKAVAVVIKKDNKIFAIQRGYGKFKGSWEFLKAKLENDTCYKGLWMACSTLKAKKWI